jgi:hypothetical protein
MVDSDVTTLIAEVQHHIASALVDCANTPSLIECRIDYEFRCDPTRAICYGDARVEAGYRALVPTEVARLLSDVSASIDVAASSFARLPRFGRVEVRASGNPAWVVESLKLSGRYRSGGSKGVK